MSEVPPDGKRDDELVRAATLTMTPLRADELSAEPRASDDMIGRAMGRYRLRERLGEGGMGVVFAAHDPELDRTVAVKVLRPGVGGRGSEGEQRLRREGQTMARLTHVNVIRVYDVGVEGDAVFVAMEYVAGGTLKDWLAAAPRRIDEILDVFTQAGRGLAAAHETGLVHRDFKPSNVLVSEDGRVLVTDFGLARPPNDGAGDPIERDDPSPSPLGRTITRAGAVVGTPAYMAPEQHGGRPVDARADQFSFCVSLWRALYGAPPYAGDDDKALAAAIESGRLADPPASARVPAHVRAALARGLSPAPDARFASMPELLYALTNDPMRRRRRLRAGAILGALLVAGLAMAWMVGRRVAQHPCDALDDRFAGIWDGPSRQKLHDALVATGVPYAETTFAEVARQLDNRRAAWTAMRLQSCEATLVRKVQSDSMFDLRSECLERRARDIAIFVDGMRHVDAAAMRTAAAVAADVGDVAVCGDVSALSRRAPLPGDAQQRQTIAAIERDLEPVRALVAGGRYREAEAGAARLADRARAAGYAPLVAEALAVSAHVQDSLTHLPVAEKLYGESSLAADAGGDDERRFTDEVALLRLVGAERERAADSALHAQRAQAILQRLGFEPRRQAFLERALAVQSWWFGRYDEARERASHAVALLEKVDPAGPEMVRALHMLSIAQQELKDYGGSLASEQRARLIGEKALGANHPLMAQSWETSGGTLRQLGRYAEAEQHLKRGLALIEDVSGPQSHELASALENLGTLYLDQARYDDAVRLLNRSVALLKSLYGPEHSRVADAEDILAGALSKAGHKAEAEAMLERVIAAHRRQLGPDSPVTAMSVRHLGDHYLRLGQPARAMPLYEESLRATEASQGAKSPLLARPLNNIAEAAIALHQQGRAIAAYERALALSSDEDPLHAGVAFELAKLLRSSAPARARELATRARALFVAQGEPGAADVAKVDAWLRTP